MVPPGSSGGTHFQRGALAQTMLRRPRWWEVQDMEETAGQKVAGVSGGGEREDHRRT